MNQGVKFGYLALLACYRRNWSSTQAFRAGGLTIDRGEKVLESHKLNGDNIIYQFSLDQVFEMAKLREKGMSYVKIGAKYGLSDVSVIRLLRHHNLWKPGHPGRKKQTMEGIG